MNELKRDDDDSGGGGSIVEGGAFTCWRAGAFRVCPNISFAIVFFRWERLNASTPGDE